MKNEPFDRAKWLPFFIMAVLLVTIYVALGHLDTIATAISVFMRVISPLLLGVLFAYFMYVPQRIIEKLIRKLKIKKFTFISDRARGISTVIIFLLLILAIAVILSFLLPIIVNSVVDLTNSIPGYVREIAAFLDNIPEDSIFAGIDLGDILQENTGTIVDALLSSTSSSNLEQAAGAVAGVFSGFFNVILGIFIALYILLYRDEMGEYFTRLNNAVFKNAVRRDKIFRYMSQINKVMRTFIASKGVDAMCNFTAATVITTIFGVPYSVLLGVMAGLFNFIPYVGSIISSLLISILAFLTCPTPMALGTTISIIAFQQFDGNFIEPRIFKTSLKLNPILVIMAVVIGGAYFGIAGMFLAVPISVIIKQLLQEYIESTETVNYDDIRR